MRKLALVLLALLAVGCGSTTPTKNADGYSDGYPSGFGPTFVTSCLNTASDVQSTCTCALSYLEDHVSYSRAASDLAAGDFTDAPVSQAMTHCENSDACSALEGDIESDYSGSQLLSTDVDAIADDLSSSYYGNDVPSDVSQLKTALNGQIQSDQLTITDAGAINAPPPTITPFNTYIEGYKQMLAIANRNDPGALGAANPTLTKANAEYNAMLPALDVFCHEKITTW
ncbi:MAG: hypothetical protein ABSG43_09450 [Solirubrobacteraceae bacterium]|jgi:hypothetical protein